jgi:Family of unknown function (DUF6918)
MGGVSLHVTTPLDPSKQGANHALAPVRRMARTGREGIRRMASLKELIARGDKRRDVVSDACKVLDAEVADKTGLGGIAVKGAYKVVQSVKPGFVREVVDHLLDDFLDGLDPIYQEALDRHVAPGAHLKANRERVAEALLAVTDSRAEKSDHGMLRKTYSKLRPAARKHVEAAAPRLADMLDHHAPSAS